MQIFYVFTVFMTLCYFCRSVLLTFHYGKPVNNKFCKKNLSNFCNMNLFGIQDEGNIIKKAFEVNLQHTENKITRKNSKTNGFVVYFLDRHLEARLDQVCVERHKYNHTRKTNDIIIQKNIFTTIHFPTVVIGKIYLHGFLCFHEHLTSCNN